MGLFGLGLLPLAVDLGVELCYESVAGFEGTVNGIVQAASVGWGLASIYATEPSTIHMLVPTHYLILLWTGMLVLGGLLYLSASWGPLRRLAANVFHRRG